MTPLIRLLFLMLFTCLTSYGQNLYSIDKETSIKISEAQVSELNGVAQYLNLAPCELTFTDSEYGLHLTVTTDENSEIYVYLGPVWATSIWTEGIENQVIHLVVFRYDYLPNNQFIAKEMHWNGQVAILRDENLVPFWVNGFNQGVW